MHQSIAERQRVFFRALQVMTELPSARWRVYLDEQTVGDDGMVSSTARPRGETSSNFDDLKKYCEAIIGQGFHLVVAIPAASTELRVLSWEQVEPEWPGDLRVAVSLRWDAAAMLPGTPAGGQ